jgi:hypothetical protein
LIERAYQDDSENAKAEYGGEFRRDLEPFLSEEVVDGCTVSGRRELPWVPATKYMAFVDPSGGSRDGFSMCIAHREGEIGVVDCIRERVPPFSPESVVEEFAQVLGEYKLNRVTGDRYAGSWVVDAFARHGIAYEHSAKAKTELYGNALAYFNTGCVELPEHAKLKGQLLGLERRTHRGGKDSIDHGRAAHDDLANACCGALVLVLARPKTWGWDDLYPNAPERRMVDDDEDERTWRISTRGWLT